MFLRLRHTLLIYRRSLSTSQRGNRRRRYRSRCVAGRCNGRRDGSRRSRPCRWHGWVDWLRRLRRRRKGCELRRKKGRDGRCRLRREMRRLHRENRFCGQSRAGTHWRRDEWLALRLFRGLWWEISVLDLLYPRRLAAIRSVLHECGLWW